MNEIEINFANIDKCILVTFNFDKHKYCLSSPPTSIDNEKVILFNILTNRLEDTSLVSVAIFYSGLTIEKEKARLIWNDLIKCKYQRVHDLERIFNKRRIDNSLRAYKIRHKHTGLYSQGGTIGGKGLWSKKGKTWNILSHLSSHLTFKKKVNPDMPDYEDAEIVELGERRSVNFDDLKDLE